MQTAPPRIVCFDLGGVVIRICRNWAEGCEAAGIDLRDDPHRSETQSARHEIIAQYQTGRINGETFSRRISDLLNRLYSPWEILTVHDAWLLGAYSGVVELIEQLHSANLQTAALSNTNHKHWVRMDEFPAVGLMTHRFASHELGVHKPDPAIFRRFEELTSRCGEEILFFDDTSENVEAARETGWRSVQIDPSQETVPQMRRTLEQEGVVLGSDQNVYSSH